MIYKIVNSPKAEKDLEKIKETLQYVSPVTIRKLEPELRAIHSQLVDFPYAYQLIDGTEIRRALLRSCRHTIFFRVQSPIVEIYAILPQKAGPDWIDDRIS